MEPLPSEYRVVEALRGTVHPRLAPFTKRVTAHTTRLCRPVLPICRTLFFWQASCGICEIRFEFLCAFVPLCLILRLRLCRAMISVANDSNSRGYPPSAFCERNSNPQHLHAQHTRQTFYLPAEIPVRDGIVLRGDVRQEIIGIAVQLDL